MNASLAGVMRSAARSRRIARVLGSYRGVLGLLRGELIDLSEQRLDLDRVRHTPAALLGSARHRLLPDDIDRALDTIRRLDVRFVHVIGGNDSADTGHRLATAAAERGYELFVVTIPKTVDNDLPETDHTPGYGSAARFVAQAVMDAGRDTESISSVDPVKIIEIGGRDAGWLTIAAGVGRRDEQDAPHLMYIPETPFSVEGFLDDVQRTFDRHGRAVIALSEAVRDRNGVYIHANGSDLYTDSFGHRQLGGVAAMLCDRVAHDLGIKAKFDKPGTIQRMLTACHSTVDLDEAERLGTAAVERVLAGVTNRMVTLHRVSDDPYHCDIDDAHLHAIANRVRTVPAEFVTDDGHAITSAFRRYAEPLIGAALPDYPRLARRFITIPSSIV